MCMQHRHQQMLCFCGSTRTSPVTWHRKASTILAASCNPWRIEHSETSFRSCSGTPEYRSSQKTLTGRTCFLLSRADRRPLPSEVDSADEVCSFFLSIQSVWRRASSPPTWGADLYACAALAKARAQLPVHAWVSFFCLCDHALIVCVGQQAWLRLCCQKLSRPLILSRKYSRMRTENFCVWAGRHLLLLLPNVTNGHNFERGPSHPRPVWDANVRCGTGTS